MRTKKIIALALSVALLAVSLPACYSVIQPTCTDIARANFSMLDSPVQVLTDLDLVNDMVVTYYSTTVDCLKEAAYWDGIATVYYNDTYFSQECISQRDGEKAAKLWRGEWALSDTETPIQPILRWLQKVEAGACIYEKKPQKKIISGIEQKVYEIMLNESAMDWNALCDADFDSLFGGESLLGNIEEAKITLLVDSRSLLIQEIRIAATGEAWIEATMSIVISDTAPLIQWKGEFLREAYLGEEWIIIGSTSEDKDAKSE